MTNHEPIYLKDYQPNPFKVESVHLSFDLDDASVRVKSLLKLSRNPNAADPTAPLQLQGEELELVWLSMNGRELDASEYTLDDKHLTIDGVPDTFSLETEVLQKSVIFQPLSNFKELLCKIPQNCAKT